MAFFQSEWAKGVRPTPTAYDANGLVFVRFEFTFSKAWAFATDKLELGILPAFCSIADAWMLPEGLTASNAFDIGLMSGTPGVADGARTVGDEIFDGAAAVGTFIRASKPAGFLITPQPFDRSIGVIGTHDIAADAAKKVHLGLTLYAGR